MSVPGPVVARHSSAEDLSALIDRGLADGERQAVELHLAACDSCRRRHEGMLGAVLVLRGIARPPLDVAARSRVRLALRGRLLVEARTGFLAATVEALRPWLGGLVGAALFFVCLAFGLEGSGRLRAAEVRRDAWERALELARFESFLAEDAVADGRWVDGVWLDPGLDARLPVRRLRADSREARRWLAARPEAERALRLPGVRAVRLRAGAAIVEIELAGQSSSRTDPAAGVNRS